MCTVYDGRQLCVQTFMDFVLLALDSTKHTHPHNHSLAFVCVCVCVLILFSFCFNHNSVFIFASLRCRCHRCRRRRRRRRCHYHRVRCQGRLIHMCTVYTQRCDAAKGSADDHFNQKAMLLADRLAVNISNCVDCWDYGRPK